MEIGVRASPSGSKPHSYGDSLLMSGFIVARVLIVYSRVDVREEIAIRIAMLIISSRLGLNAWKALVLLY